MLIFLFILIGIFILIAAWWWFSREDELTRIAENILIGSGYRNIKFTIAQSSSYGIDLHRKILYIPSICQEEQIGLVISGLSNLISGKPETSILNDSIKKSLISSAEILGYKFKLPPKL